MPPEGWQRLSAGEGAKGPRLYDWAYTPYRGGAPLGWEKGLLVRRKLDEPDELAFHLTLAPEGTGLATLVRVAGTRWTIEACFEAAKGEVNGFRLRPELVLAHHEPDERLVQDDVGPSSHTPSVHAMV